MQLLLADDHLLFREAIVYYIERNAPDFSLRIAGDLHGTIELLGAQSRSGGATFDLVLLDLKMPGMHSLSGLEKLRDAFPQQPVAIISGLAEERDINEAKRLGARGYFPKTLSAQALLAGVRQVIAGTPYFALDHNSGRLMQSYMRDAASAGFQNAAQADSERSVLTTRERQVLDLLGDGSSNKQIATRLGLQVATVKLYVRGVCRKLGAANRTQAALLAREHAV